MHRFVVVAGLLLALLAGCTTSQAGQPAGPAPSNPPASSATSAPPSPRVSVPPRPAELRLDGVDPCALFTSAQLAALTVERKRPLASSTEIYQGMRECGLFSDRPPFAHYDALAVTNEGVEAWFTGKRNVQTQLRSVAGFAAATYWLAGASGKKAVDCSTSVDVAEGQQLIVTFDNTNDRTFTLEQLCQKAEQAAAMAVETLKTLK